LREPVCRITCDMPDVPTGDDNLIARAWRALRQACPERVGGLSVRLTKRIPAGAGLGGGSSNAAATLYALRRIYRLPLSRAQLENHALAVGCDCPFFLRGGAVLATGLGEIMTSLPNRLPPLWLVVAWPGF